MAETSEDGIWSGIGDAVTNAFGDAFIESARAGMEKGVAAKGEFHYTPEQLNKVIAILEDVIAETNGDQDIIDAIPRLIEPPSDDLMSVMFATKAKDNIKNLRAKNHQLRKVAQQMLDAHLVARKNIQETEDANEQAAQAMTKGLSS